MRKRSIALVLLIVVAAGAISAFLVVRSRRWSAQLFTIQGAVLRDDKDARRRTPIPDTVITATVGQTRVSSLSDASGYYRITFPRLLWPGETVILSYEHPGYERMDQTLKFQYRSVTRRIFIAALKPVKEPQIVDVAAPAPGAPLQAVTNIRIRYTENFESDENIGSVVRTFQIANQSNVPCHHQSPCSPDGYWKATPGSLALDAGDENEFKDVRVACIAGPCPFTRIDASGFAQGGRKIVASAIDWSEPTTFLLEAEVFRTSIASNVRYTYPLLFGETLTFTLPPTQEGVSIEADVNGAPMVFPLGPDLFLSWADCAASTSPGAARSTAYHCELKPGYKF